MNIITCGDCIEVLKEFPNNCIDLTLTSPPYDNLRMYSGEYTYDLKAVANHLFRITKIGGVVVLVIGDATIKGSETGTSFRHALYYMEIGFNLHDTMIYAKNNPIPQNHNRYEQQFEYMFVFSKGKPKTFNPRKIPTKGAGKEYSWKDTNDYGPKSAKRSRDEVSVVKEYKNDFNIWYYNTAIGKYTNSAPFPVKLVRDHILSWSNEGDLVLDPMSGSGTTCVVAKLLNRNYIGIDISEEYCKMAEERIRVEKNPDLLED